MNSVTTKKPYSGEFMSFVLCFATAIMLFLPFAIVDKGFFQFCGDYNSQQIPFYYYLNSFFKDGGGSYSWISDLGGSIANTYSFYLIGSPFFWLSYIFPAAWMPYLMVPLFALKFGVAGLGAYIYLKRYSKNVNFAVLGACLYACSGQMIYNTFFNHFLDCIALFPFMLWALDSFVIDKKVGFFAFFVALNLINNYFFFAGEVVFLFIYFFVKLYTGEYKIKFKRFMQLALEALLGVGMGCLLLIPAIISLADNPRTIDFSNGFGLLIYSKAQQYFAIFSSLFFPPDPPYLPNVFQEGVIKWTSMSAFLPIMGCAGVIAFMRAKKQSAVRKILLICLFMAMVPVLNSSFIMLNSSYYARWFYMPVLLMCAASMQAMQDEEIDIVGGIKTTFFITLGFAAFGLVPTLKDEKWQIGVADEAARFWLTFGLAVLMLLGFYALVRYKRHNSRFVPLLCACILGYTVLYGVIFIAIGKFPQWDNDKNYRQQLYVDARNNPLPNDEFYRVDAYECYDNIGLWMNKPVLQFFNSTVTPSIMEFYPSIGVKRDVSSKPEAEKYAIRGLLSVKYMVVNNDKRVEFDTDISENGWKYLYTEGKLSYYENENYIPMGFAYDEYFEYETFEETPEATRANLLVSAIGLDKKQIEKYGNLMRKSDNLSYGYEAYVQNVTQRKNMSAYYFNAHSKGFDAKISLEKDNLVFFSVPYDKGFEATVNGKKVDIEKVSGGMMAVACSEGDNEISFVYHTQGMKTSAIITLISILTFIGYIYIQVKNKKKAGIPQ